MAWDEGLRDEQASAASAPRSHHVLLAGPGTGKTFVLVRRIEYLIEVEDFDPSEIAAITFTRAAAAEMRQRLQERLGPAGSRVRTSTLHSLALRELIRKGARQLPAPLRVAGNWEERHVVVEELARLLDRRVRDISNRRGTGALDLLADDWDTLNVDGDGWEAGHADAPFLGAWRRHREVYGYTLRSELVYQLLVELRSNPEFRLPQLKAVVVDEYQDLNRCDLNTVQHLAARCDTEVYGAGDDDQSIYMFRNAVPAGIRAFTSEYADADRLVLTECMRCGQDIVELANWLIRQEGGREEKELRSVTPWSATVHLLRFRHQAAEAGAIARLIDAEIAAGTPAESILILLKSDPNNRVASAIEKALGEADIHIYRPRGAGDIGEDMNLFLEYLILAKALRQRMSDDLALRAILELEDNGIGFDRLWSVTELALDRGIRYSRALEYVEANPDEFRRSRLTDVIRERDRILASAEAIVQEEGEPLLDWIARVAEMLGLSPDSHELVRSLGEGIELELADEQETENEEAEAVSRDFVAELLAAMTNLSDSLPTHVPDHVTLTTMHGAKGLSADIVFALQIEDEMIPGDAVGAELEEARRLLYVSLTRARKKLVIGACRRRTGPQRFAGSKELENRTLSRFVRDYGLVAQTIAEYLHDMKE